MKTIPCGWYYAGKSKEFNSQVKSTLLADKKVLLFRTPEGDLKATQSHCPHMNADLSRAQVTKTGIVCPLHKWHFSHNGPCLSIPGQPKQSIPAHACLDTYSVAECAGHAFVHSEANTVQTLPFFASENMNDYHISRPYQLEGHNHWSVAAANAFDLSHFEHVHHRTPTETILSDFSSQDSCHLSLSYEIKAKNMADRWLVRKYGSSARLDYSVYNGQLIVAKTSIGDFRNRMMVFVQPYEEKFKATLFVFTPKKHPFSSRIKNAISAYFSYRFFQKECEELNGIKIDPAKLADHEVLLKNYFNWLEPQMPQRNESSSVSFGRNF